MLKLRIKKPEDVVSLGNANNHSTRSSAVLNKAGDIMGEAQETSPLLA